MVHDTGYHDREILRRHDRGNLLALIRTILLGAAVLLLLLLFLNAHGWAQLGGQDGLQPTITIQYVASAPSGTCGNFSPLTVVIGTGALYTCQSGHWAAAGGGGGVTSFFGNTGNITALADPTVIVDTNGASITFQTGGPPAHTKQLILSDVYGDTCTFGIGGVASGIICVDTTPDTFQMNEGTINLQDDANDLIRISDSPGIVDISDTNGDDCQLQTGTWTCSTPSISAGVQTLPITVAQLPSCGGFPTTEGSMYAITDYPIPAVWGATITTGGGSTHVLAYCDGTNWVVAAP
jgi:hypothetical protein